MQLERRLDCEGILRTHVSGPTTFEDCERFFEQLESFITHEELFEVVVHGLDWKMVQPVENYYRAINRARGILTELRRGAIAFVGESDLAFGLCRQMQSVVGDQRTEVAVFRTENEALAWLRKKKSSSD